MRTLRQAWKQERGRLIGAAGGLLSLLVALATALLSGDSAAPAPSAQRPAYAAIPSGNAAPQAPAQHPRIAGGEPVRAGAAPPAAYRAPNLLPTPLPTVTLKAALKRAPRPQLLELCAALERRLWPDAVDEATFAQAAEALVEWLRGAASADQLAGRLGQFSHTAQRWREYLPPGPTFPTAVIAARGGVPRALPVALVALAQSVGLDAAIAVRAAPGDSTVWLAVVNLEDRWRIASTVAPGATRPRIGRRVPPLEALSVLLGSVAYDAERAYMTMSPAARASDAGLVRLNFLVRAAETKLLVRPAKTARDYADLAGAFRELANHPRAGAALAADALVREGENLAQAERLDPNDSALLYRRAEFLLARDAVAAALAKFMRLDRSAPDYHPPGKTVAIVRVLRIAASLAEPPGGPVDTARRRQAIAAAEGVLARASARPADASLGTGDDFALGGHLAYREAAFATARALLDAAERRGVRTAALYRQRGKLALSEAIPNRAAAQANFLAALKADPTDRASLVGLIRLAFEDGDRAQAERWCAQGLTQRPDDPLLLKLAGLVARDLLHDLALARSRFTAYLAKVGSDKEVEAWLAALGG